MTGRPARIVIVGKDAALWLTAVALTEALGPTGLKVTAIELPSSLKSASLYATLPALESLHSRLGIDEAQLLRACRGSFSLGWNIVRPNSPPFLLAHGSYGAPIDGADFFSFWQKARHFGLDVALENFSPTAMAARNGRILVPDESTEMFGRTDYAYHLPAIAYCTMLKSRAHRLGVAIHQTLRIGLERHGVGGKIKAVIPDGGKLVEGDLFIDASGRDAVLIGRGLGIEAEDWRSFFPFEHVLRATGPRYPSVPAYAELRVGETSWTALLGSQAATYLVHAYKDGSSSADKAIESAAKISGLALGAASIETSAPMLRTRAWAENCVAIGSSACAFDPLFDLDLHAVQLGIVHLLSLFPTANEAASGRAEYNRIMRSLFERLRDFQSAFYALTAGEPEVPATLKQKLDAFEARGTIAAMEDETFSADQWRALFVGLGLLPESWPPAIDRTAGEQMKEGFRRILGFVHDKVLEQPGHDEYLADIGASGAS